MQAQGKTVNLLSIGSKKAGKTVFLASSYAELSGRDGLQLGFDDEREQELAEILETVAQSDQYFPTAQTTEFLFRLRSSAEIDHLRWWDVPGGDSRLTNPDFQAMVLRSHGCCVFINAEELLHQTPLEELQQLQAIALLGRHSVCYPIAVILTHVDRLDTAVGSLQPRLEPLYKHLEAAQANYKVFFSGHPIKQSTVPDASGALIWWLSTLLNSSYQDLGTQLRQSLARGNKLWDSNQYLPRVVQTSLTILAMTNVNLQTLPAMEKLALEEPENVQLQINLARSYEHQGQNQQAEMVYDRVLAKQANIKALLGKALLRQAQGDFQTACQLLAQAQQVAPTVALKAKISAIALQVGSRSLSNGAKS